MEKFFNKMVNAIDEARNEDEEEVEEGEDHEEDDDNESMDDNNAVMNSTSINNCDRNTRRKRGEDGDLNDSKRMRGGGDEIGNQTEIE